MNKKVGLIVLVVVLALGALGVGYAVWSQDLTITAQVNTGSFDTKLVDVSATGDANEVATVAVDTSDTSGHTIIVTITNGYPGFSTAVSFSINDPGAVPAEVTGIDIPTGTNATVTNTGTIDTGTTIAASGTTSGGQFTIQIKDSAAQNVVNETYTITIHTAQQF